jgi:serine protease Do
LIFFSYFEKILFGFFLKYMTHDEKKSYEKTRKTVIWGGSILLVLFLSLSAGFFGAYTYNKFFFEKEFVYSEEKNPQIEESPSKDISQPKVSLPPQNISEHLSSESFISVANSLKDSVVSISVKKEFTPNSRLYIDPFFNDPFFQQFFGDDFSVPNMQDNQQKPQKREIGAGTGFVVTKDGLVLTNKHVVSDTDAEYTVVFSDNTEYFAEVVAKDPTNDVAILRIQQKNGEEKIFTPVQFIETMENIQVGQFVVAIGNALGEFGNTLTTGIISAKGRRIQAGDGMGTTEQLRELLQTDAAINPGNSGGPLVGLDGRVLGMNTAIASTAEGIGFAIPFDQKKIEKILSQVEKYGKIIRPFLGVRYQIITPELNKELSLGSDTGAWIRGQNDTPAILPDTPAAKAGLKGGDIILSVEGEEVNESNDLQSLIAKYSPGDTLQFEILRDGNRQSVSVVLEERKEEVLR